MQPRVLFRGGEERAGTQRQKPGARVVVLYRDIRTYGSARSTIRRRARRACCSCALPEARSRQVSDVGGLQVKVTDAGTGLELNLKPDWLVLSTGIAPGAGQSGVLGSAAHPRSRPTASSSKRIPSCARWIWPNEGEYLAGLAHSPRFIDETIAHAKAVAGRAATILSRAKLDIAGQVAKVDPEGCVACATCVKVCPVRARP